MRRTLSLSPTVGGVDRGLVRPSVKISSFSELLDMLEQSRKKIWTRVTRFKIKVRLQHFFFLLRFLIGLTKIRHDHKLTDLLFTYISWIVIIFVCLALYVVILSVFHHLSAFFYFKIVWFSRIPMPCSSWCLVDAGDAFTQPPPRMRSINSFQTNEPTDLCSLVFFLLSSWQSAILIRFP